MTLEKIKIGDVCLITDYVANGSFASLRENVKYLDGDGYAVLVRLTDFTKNWKNSFRYVSKHAYEFLKHSKLYPGDLIISNVGEPGKTFLVPDLGKPATLGPNSVLIRPDSSILSTQYLKYFIDSNYGQKLINSIVNGTTQKKFNKTSLRNLEITIPSIKEQQRIVAKLDAAFAEINKMIKEENNKINYFKQLLIKYLETQILNQNELLSVDKVCEVLDNLRKPITKRFREKGPFPYFGATGIKDYVKDFIFDEKLVLLGEDGAKWDKGERTAFIADGKYWVNNHAHVLRPIKDLMLHEWLVYYFYITDLKPWVTGLTVPKLNKEKMLSIKIPTPSIKIQKEKIKKIFQFESNHKEFIKLANKKIDNLKTLKSSILYTELK